MYAAVEVCMPSHDICQVLLFDTQDNAIDFANNYECDRKDEENIAYSQWCIIQAEKIWNWKKN